MRTLLLIGSLALLGCQEEVGTGADDFVARFLADFQSLDHQQLVDRAELAQAHSTEAAFGRVVAEKRRIQRIRFGQPVIREVKESRVLVAVNRWDVESLADPEEERQLLFWVARYESGWRIQEIRLEATTNGEPEVLLFGPAPANSPKESEKNGMGDRLRN